MLQRFLPAEEGFAADVIRAVNYSMNAGGKRIRPVLVLESFRLFSAASAGNAAGPAPDNGGELPAEDTAGGGGTNGGI